MVKAQKVGGQKAARELKRGLILDAARKVFETDGLDGASLRAIAAASDYTPAALYFHFESKEAITPEVLLASLANLGQAVGRAILRVKEPADRFEPPRWHSSAIMPTIPETLIWVSTCFAVA